MNFFEIANLHLQLREFSLHNLSLQLPRGKVMVILGPSGAGKSVLLETIAGFYHPAEGRIYLGGRDITLLPAEKRRVGFMFQDYALFPHWTVQQNVLSPLRFQHKNEDQTHLDPEQIMDLLNIAHLADRYPANLSGGEKQRVALARALMSSPELLLFDEPMSALDARAREELREELGQLLHQWSLTAIYVTHDQAEALVLGDIIGILQEGRLVQCGCREEVFKRPATPFVARFVGMENLFPGNVLQVHQEEDGSTTVGVEVEPLGVLVVRGNYEVKAGEKVCLGIRPEDILLVESGGESAAGAGYWGNLPPPNILPLTVAGIIPWGLFYKLKLQGKVPLTVFAVKTGIEGRGIVPGAAIQAVLPPAAIHLLK
ncbi:ABC transporter ATP-binding protein [Moorella naiadis]|uniref:ABC transporter ATP-binding protein n=1 Tax=Moorella naiadis (nom. illeg.) TaxID=3093670 RepID=UPI003D9C7DB0